MLLKSWNNLQISQRFMMAITPSLILLLVGGCFLLDRYVSKSLTTSYEKSVSILSDSLQESVKGSLERGQMKNFQTLLWNQRNIEGVLEVSLFTKEGLLDMSSVENASKGSRLDEKTFATARESKHPFVTTNEKEYMVYTPQVTTSDCIRCHQNWELEKLGGIIRLTYDLTRLKDTIKQQRLYLTYGCIGLVCIITCLVFFITGTVTRPVVQMTKAMKQLAENDLSVPIPGENRRDEIGDMGAAVKVFKQNAQERDELEKALDKMADSFEDNVGTILAAVLDELTDIQQAVIQVSENAETTSALSASVVEASTTTAENVQQTAQAIDGMNTTNVEINAQVESAADVSTKAVKYTTETNELVNRLTKSASDIEQVVGLISDIAEQTDLLALNATIEAARAGETGKGFAVVAGEVKELAAQTKKATRDIADKIQSIQSSSSESVNAIQGISGTLTNINDIAMTIAQSVGRQQETSADIGHSMKQAAGDSESVSNNLANVVEATQETGLAVITVQNKINDLVQQTDILKVNLNDFLQHVRNRG